MSFIVYIGREEVEIVVLHKWESKTFHPSMLHLSLFCNRQLTLGEEENSLSKDPVRGAICIPDYYDEYRSFHCLFQDTKVALNIHFSTPQKWLIATPWTLPYPSLPVADSDTQTGCFFLLSRSAQGSLHLLAPALPTHLSGSFFPIPLQVPRMAWLVQLRVGLTPPGSCCTASLQKKTTQWISSYCHDYSKHTQKWFLDG